MKLAQEEIVARYDGCCNHQLLPTKKTQKIILHKIKLSQSYRKVQERRKCNKILQINLIFHSRKIVFPTNYVKGQQCSDGMQKGGDVKVSKQVHR